MNVLSVMKFSYNEVVDYWEAPAMFQGREVNLRIDRCHPESEHHAIANEAIARMLEHWPRIHKNIADSLHKTYNEAWSDPEEGMPELTRDSFLKRILLRTIDIGDECALSLYFSDDDLFGGHGIYVFWDSDDTMYGASLVG